MPPSSQPETPDLEILPWPDPVIDTLGHDPRSLYVETFWLPTLGPTGVLLLRHLADRFEVEPEGFRLDPAQTSGRLGLGVRAANNTPLRKALLRLVSFGFAHHSPPGEFRIRRYVPPVPRRHAHRLPESLRPSFEEWHSLDARRPPHDVIRRRARARAFVLFDLGEDRAQVERTLTRTGFPSRVVGDAIVWARARVHELDQRSEGVPTTAA